MHKLLAVSLLPGGITVTVTLIGSRAMRHWFPDAREPRGDWDWQGSFPVEHAAFTVQGEHHDTFTDERLRAWDWGVIATPDELYTLKVSHAFWEIGGPKNWDKHASDIRFLKRKGAVFLRPLYDIVLPIWKERYKRNPVSLDKSARNFFADAVNRKYDHDSVHETIAYYDRPLYESVLRDGSEVAVDNAKFEALDYEVKLQLVREEVYATALERILIPRDYQGSPGAAYHWALRRTATSLFKGDWALFLVLNLDRLMRPDCDYVRRHIQNKGKLRLNGDGSA
jgi:hypothetical protein